MATRVAAAKEVESSILVCDLGFSSLKWYCNGNKGRIVSAIQRQGAVTHIGEDALITTGSSYLKTMEELVNAYPLFCERAVQEAGITGPATLAVGLPYGFWAAEREAPGNGAIGMLERALKGAMFDAVYVLPQGLGGVRAHIEELEQAGQVSGNILGIDIGFNTVIFTLYDPSRNRIIYGDTFNKRGVHQLAMKHLLPRIKALAPSRTYTPVEISYLMERGFVQYGFEQHDIRPQIYESADEYLTIVLQDISGELQAHVGDRAVFNQVVIFGGGARLLDGRISSQTIQIKVLDEPEYANAQGFHAIASQLLDGGLKC